MEDYFDGSKLYGDDFSHIEIKKWFEEESEGYANLGSKDRSKYKYPYHNMNLFYGFNRLPKEYVFSTALGIGSAYGDEFLPIIDRINAITIVEPSDQLVSERIGNIIPIYSKPLENGHLNFEKDTFDLITCFGVLHHIPNVSFVLSELKRVLKPNGFLLIKEPIHTMGDWRNFRKGLTKNERGIPLNYFTEFIRSNKMVVISSSLCDCAFIYRLFGKIIKRDSRMFQMIDSFVARLLKWNYRYHRTRIIHKLAPATIFLILSKK